MKNLLTSITSLLLVVVMLFGMTACGGNGDNGGIGGDEEPPTDAEGNTIVKIMFHVDKSSTEG